MTYDTERFKGDFPWKGAAPVIEFFLVKRYTQGDFDATMQEIARVYDLSPRKVRRLTRFLIKIGFLVSVMDTLALSEQFVPKNQRSYLSYKTV